MAVARLEPKYGYCPACGEAIHNRGAHAESCPGPRSNANEREWTGWYQVSGLCGCPPRRDGGRCPHMNEYVPTFRVTQTPEEA